LPASHESEYLGRALILHGVSLLGIGLRSHADAGSAGDMEAAGGGHAPGHLKEMTRTIPFDELTRAFEGLLKGAAKGRIVVDLAA